jgi:prenyltransferase beta subunit
MISKILKYPLKIAYYKVKEFQTLRYVTAHTKQDKSSVHTFDFLIFKQRVLSFLKNMQTDETGFNYRYSFSCTQPTLYSSAYCCMTYSLLGHLKNMDSNLKNDWVAYFDSFQSATDGLFYDPVVKNEYYTNSDWWGARHLALHMINAYTQLGARPKYPFYFLERYYDLSYLEGWLRENKIQFMNEMANDFDNKLMNIGCLLQYQRDFFNDNKAGQSVEFIQQYLLEELNPNTGLWGNDNISDPRQRSRKVQFAYHLLPLFFFDNIYSFDWEKITDIVLGTQNQFGGFGVKANSTACEDIDSIDILIRISNLSSLKEREIRTAMEKAFKWVLSNQTNDGGFTFLLNEDFMYGHSQMRSIKNEGAIFPTWFRTLCVAYLSHYFGQKDKFKIIRCPGYEFLSYDE